jgi:magnesium chelatase family protein
LEALRQPVEDGRVVIARAQRSVSYPARFTLVGAANPCPCGHAGDPTTVCRCTASDIGRYRARLSGPLADRIDLHVFVGAMSIDALAATDTPLAESSAAIRSRVESARAMQRARYAVGANAQASGRWLDANTAIDDDARALLRTSARRLGFSARGYHRVLKVARTIADLAGSDTIVRSAMHEALHYRPSPDATPTGG